MNNIKKLKKIKIEPIYNEPEELELPLGIVDDIETINHQICEVVITGVSKDDETLELLDFKWSNLNNRWFAIRNIFNVFDFIYEKFNSFENLDLKSYYDLLDLLKADGVESIGVEWKHERWLAIDLTEDYKCYEETYIGHSESVVLEKYANPIDYFPPSLIKSVIIKQKAKIKELKEIKEGCTVSDEEPELIAIFETAIEAEKELEKYIGDVTPHGDCYLVEEYLIEKHFYNKDGTFKDWFGTWKYAKNNFSNL